MRRRQPRNSAPHDRDFLNPALASVRHNHTSDKILHRVLEDDEAVAAFLDFAAGPSRVLRRVDMAFGVRHHAQDAARRIAHARHVGLRSVGVFRIGHMVVGSPRTTRVPQNQLTLSGQIRERSIKIQDLPTCSRIYLINSVRKWQDAILHFQGITQS